MTPWEAHETHCVMYPLLDTSCLELTNFGTDGGRMNFFKKWQRKQDEQSHTVGTRFNNPEGTGDFWSLNPNVVNENF